MDRHKLDRRDWFRAAAGAGGAASALASLPSGVAGDEPWQPFWVDTNVSLFQWPFRRLPLDEPVRLVQRLRSLGIGRAWAGSYEALLHRDLRGVNDRVAEACAEHRELVPMGSINLSLPGWETDLQRCFATQGMIGIRVFPSYHGYRLDDPSFRRLLQASAEAGRPVQIAVTMEDPRTQHPRVRAADVDLRPLPEVLRGAPAAKVQILNLRPRSQTLEPLVAAPQIHFDVARMDGTRGIAQLIERVGVDRVCYGSGAPLLIPEAAAIRVSESRLHEAQLRRVSSANAQGLTAA